MDFTHPDLQRFHAGFLESMKRSGSFPDQRDDVVLELMAMVDYFRMAEWEAGGSLPSEGEENWTPKSTELKEVIERLIAPEQREGLRRWCHSQEEMNPAASDFRDWIAATISEPLKS